MQVKVHVDLAGKVDAITLRGLKADCLPFSGVTDKLAGAIAKQRKTITHSGGGFCFPHMAVADFLPSWALVRAFLSAVCAFCFRVLLACDAGRKRRRERQEAGHGPLDCRFPGHGPGSRSKRGYPFLDFVRMSVCTCRVFALMQVWTYTASTAHLHTCMEISLEGKGPGLGQLYDELCRSSWTEKALRGFAFS